jgi:hypothetical protein
MDHYAAIKEYEKKNGVPEFDFPEFLYESFFFDTKRVCLMCGMHKAYSNLCTGNQVICPICKDCSGKWNTYGGTLQGHVSVMKKIKPLKIIWNIFRYKPLLMAKATKDFVRFAAWAKKMKRLKAKLKGE